MMRREAAVIVFLLAPLLWLVLPQASNAQTPTDKPWLMKPNYIHTCRHSRLTAKEIAKEYENTFPYPVISTIPKDFKILPNRRRFTTIWSQDAVLVPEYFQEPSGFGHDFKATAIREVEDTNKTHWLVISDYSGILTYFNINNIIYLN